MKEALRVRAELVLWGVRKEAYRLYVKDLKSKSISEQDDVNRMENGGLFSRIKNLGRYEEKLEKESKEAEEAREKLEEVENILAKAEQYLPGLEMASRKYAWGEMDEEILDEAEKELLAWCRVAELAWKTAAENNACIEFARNALQEVNYGHYDASRLSAFGDRVDRFYYNIMKDFLNCVGKVRILEGITKRMAKGRTVCYDNKGKTVLFLREDFPAKEFGIHSFDFRELKGGLAIADALLWIIFDLEGLKAFFAELIEEEVDVGEALLLKMRISSCQMIKEDILGLEFGK